MAGAVTISKVVAIVLVCVTFVAGLALLFVPEKPPPELPPRRHIHEVAKTLDNPRGVWSGKWFQ
jgi:hypothetical protein